MKYFVALLFLVSVAFAYTFIKYDIFTQYDVSSTDYVYNEDGGTNPYDGDVNTSRANHVEVLMQVNTIEATSIDYVVQCLMPNGDYDDVYTYSFTSTGSKLVYLQEICYSVALGVKVTGDIGRQSVDGYIYFIRN